MNKGGAQQKGHSSKQAENIILVGRTGNGKSATANSLIGRKVFDSKSHASGVTMKCQTHGVVTKDGHKINVIDTPGLFDLSASAEFISREIVRCLTLAEGGIHAVLLVLLLSEVMRMSGNRKVVIDNKTHDVDKKAEQVHKLLSLVDDIRRSSRGEAYTDDTYHMIKEEKEKLRKKHEELESKNYSEERAAEMKNQSLISYKDNLKQMSEQLEKKLKDAAEAQEKALTKMTREEKNELNLDLKIHIPLPPISPCNIL
ncbi:PREDICTED: immune-associated nucleotide-binding protein 8 [Camelina sativa]|uniref:Immune-associated nucleotide-binding protein 8 n=1 Tax=Camelina sativa TaxID=90675 RepID=A0ABM0VYK2_CAMSA|nr:PREDICTED: immune-associated nucleotide-binding protein 8 [Camelina sativa]